jgi:hypothetical protein
VLSGVPHSLRPHVWLRLSGALRKRRRGSDLSYKQIVRASGNDHLMTSRQIEKDLLRTLPANACFSAKKAIGIPRLRRILRGVAWLFPDIGYCQVCLCVYLFVFGGWAFVYTHLPILKWQVSHSKPSLAPFLVSFSAIFPEWVVTTGFS